MKITVKQKEFATALARANTTVQTKETIPVLSFVRIEVAGVNATVSASDLGVSSVTTFPIEKSDGDGALLFPAKRGAELINAITSAELTIETEGDSIVVKAGKGKFKLPSLPVSLFPVIEEMPPTKVVLNLTSLQRVLGRVDCAAPSKEGRFSVPVLQLESNGATLRAVGTDGFRIAVASEPGNFGEFTLLIPKNTVPLLRDLRGETVAFSESETNYFFSADGSRLLTRKSPAKFPAYQSATKTDAFTTTVVMHSDTLKLTLLRHLPLLGDNPAIRLEVTAPDQLSIYSLAENGMGDEFSGATVTGASNKVRLNPNFILDFLAQIDGDVTVQLISETKLVKFTFGDNFQYFVMPTMEPSKEAPKPKA